MRGILRIVIGATCLLAAQAATAQWFAEAHLTSDPAHKLGLGQKLDFGPDAGNWNAGALDQNGDGNPDLASVGFAGSTSWSFEFGVKNSPTGIAPGTFPDAIHVFSDKADPHRMQIWGGGITCNPIKGSFTVQEAEFKQKLGPEYDVIKLKVAFEHFCVGPGLDPSAKLVGTVSYSKASTPNPDEPSDPTEPEPTPPPPPPPPPSAMVHFPAGEIEIGNSAEITVPIFTTTYDGYEGEVRLSAFAPPGLSLSFSPDVIPAPGSGASVATVTTTETLLPARYLVEVRATGGERPYVTVVPINVLCDPPFVLGIDAPASKIVTAGEEVELTVLPQGSGPIRIQWYRGPRGSVWFPIGEATEVTYVTPPVLGTAQYWVRVSNPCGTWDSPTITLRNTVRVRAVGR